MIVTKIRHKRCPFYLRLWLWAATFGIGMLIWQKEHAHEELKLLFLAALLGLLMAFLLPLIFRSRALCRIAVAESVIVLAPILFSAILFSVGEASAYATAPETEADRSALFGNREVMIIVPHQDDEINLAGGIMEEYIRAGSHVRVVYATNGDYFIPAEKRIAEADKALSVLGVPSEAIVLMGYGSGTAPGGTLLIDAVGEPMTSHAGHTSVYGTESHPAWNEGAAYTHEQFVSDLADVLLFYRPDVILAMAADPDPDHQACCRMFEEALIAVSVSDPDYAPCVLRGYAYRDGWSAPADFLSGQIESLPAEYENESPMLSLPVSTQAVSLLSAEMTSVGRALSCYRSQDISRRAERLVNADKLFYRYSSEFSNAETFSLPIWKFIGSDGCYLYDCLTDKDGDLLFSYRTEDVSSVNFTASTDNSVCTLSQEAGGYKVHCPPGESCIVSAISAEGAVLDSFRVTHFRPITRFFVTHFDSFTRFAPDQLCTYYRELAGKIHLYLHR